MGHPYSVPSYSVAGLSTSNICIIVKVAAIKNEHITLKNDTIITVSLYHKVKRCIKQTAERGNIIMSRNLGERENFQLLIKSPQQFRQWQQRICESVQYYL